LRDEDFRAVFVVAGAEGARGVALGDEAEAVAGGFVLGGVVAEIFPEMIGERVFRVGMGL